MRDLTDLYDSYLGHQEFDQFDEDYRKVKKFNLIKNMLN